MAAPPSKRAHLDAQLMVLPTTTTPAAPSFLEFPTLRLEGAHVGLVLSCAFSPSGRQLASSSRDRSVALWSIGASCSHACSLKGHKGAVLRVAWLAEAGQLATASADGNAAVWDSEAGALVRTLKGHGKIVNDVCASRRGAPLLASASDDGGLRAFLELPAGAAMSAPSTLLPPSPSAVLWDARSRHVAAQVVPVGGHPLLSCAMDAEGGALLCGGIDGAISCFDLRGGGGGGGGGAPSAPAVPLFRIAAHGDGVCSLAFSPDGTRALSFALDGSLSTFDVRPFCAAPSRQLAAFSGATQSAEAALVRGGWSADGERVVCGSSDKTGRAWDAGSGQLLLSLPGHTGCVTEACFHPSEGLIATCGDRTVWLSEVQ